ncbi:MAG TPA: diaminopimelate epimerase [Steroidobacteraceae bacterium]|nr:diaminopimelate epimerase [Steroidobacteraceae bacterium]
MRLSFTKMHGLGNDFIVLDAPSRDGLSIPATRWRQLAERHRGIGFDQALVLEPPRRADTLAYYRIFNADGGEVEQCGNGVRCLAELLRRRGLASTGRLQLESPGGLVVAELGAPGSVTVDMGEPLFTPGAVAFDAQGEAGPQYHLDLPSGRVEFSIASMGNPHAVIGVPAVADAAVAVIGPALESHPRFARRVNVGFCETVARDHVRLRVFERGVGETQACGTGACAAAATGIRAGRLAQRVQVDLTGGTLIIRWQGPGHRLWMEGPAEVSFTGQFDL